MIRQQPLGCLATGVLTVLVIAGIFAIAGCQGPVVPNRNMISVFPQIHLTSYNLQGKIQVSEPIVSRVGGGQLDVVIPVRNLTSDKLDLQYQYRFLDTRGAQVEQTSGWSTCILPPYAMAQIHFTSLTPTASNFDCDIGQLR